MSIGFILFFLYISCLIISPNIIATKTKPKDSNYIYCSNKFIILFCIANIFCFLFLNKIREHRKIEHYKFRIKRYNTLKNLYDDYFLDDEYESEIKKIERYLKLKKLK